MGVCTVYSGKRLLWGSCDPASFHPQGFLCFVLVFCALLQVAYWKFHSPTQVSARGPTLQPRVPSKEQRLGRPL